MPNIISNVVTEIATIAVSLTVDRAELVDGAVVKVGQIGSVDSQPVYMYLSTKESVA